MKKVLLVIIIAVVLIGVAVYYFVYNKPHRDIVAEKAAYSLPASELYNSFISNPDNANEKYLNKVVSVTGTVTDVAELNDNEVKLVLSVDDDMFGVACSFSGDEADKAKIMQEGNEVTIKGLCTGYSGDDVMPGDVVLIKCSIQND
jgi:hypothetical protein